MTTTTQSPDESAETKKDEFLHKQLSEKPADQKPEASDIAPPVTDKNAPITQNEIDMAIGGNVAGLPNHALEAAVQAGRDLLAQGKMTKEEFEVRAEVADHNLIKAPEAQGGFVGDVLGPALKG